MGFGMGMGMGGGGMGFGSNALRRALDADSEEFGKPFDGKLYARLWPYIRVYKTRVLIAVVLMLIATASAVATPYFLQLAIDGPIRHKQFTGLLVLAIAFVVVQGVNWVSTFGQTYLMTYAGQWALYRLSEDVFWHLQLLPIAFYDRNETGRIMSRAQNDISVLQQLLSSGMLGIIASSLTTFGTLFSLNWRLAGLVFLTLPLIIAIIAVWQRFARSSFVRTRATISLVNASLQENVSGIRIIQSLTRENVNKRQFGDLIRRNLEANLEAARVSAIIQPIVELVNAIAIGLVIGAGGAFVLSGSLTLGALVSFTVYVNRLFDPIGQVTQQYSTLQRSTVAAERVFALLDEPLTVAERPDAYPLPPVRGRVAFEHVDFSYVPGVPVLRDFNLVAEPGQTVALVGHTGAGKSTVISLLERFYDVTGGRITIDGHDIRAVTLASLRGQIGIVLQEPYLFSGTIIDNIRLGKPDATRAEVQAVAELLGLHALIERLPDGYDTIVRERGGNLSVGQRQLISFARALIKDPRILLLDEATANIDTRTEARLQRALATLLEGRTAFVIAHRLTTIRNADLIVVMREGSIVEQGTHAELLARGGYYYELYTLGFQTAAAASAAG